MTDTAVATVEPATSMIASLTRAEIDTQITTARAYPRNIPAVQKRIMDLACLDDITAEECLYAVKRGGKTIKGPSIRFAEIVKQAYGNCRVGSRVVHVDRTEGFVEAEGIFHDLETNAATTKRTRRRILDKNGKLYNDDMTIMTGNAACSIALRNAVLDAVPKPIWRRAYEQVEYIIAGDAKTLVERREAAVKAFAVWNITPEQICAYLGVKTIEDIATDHLVLLTGARSAIKNGEETIDSIFYPSAGVKGQRANPFATTAEGEKEKPADSNTREDGPADGDASSQTPARQSKEADEPTMAVLLQEFSDALWTVEKVENLHASAENARKGLEARGSALEIQVIHKARLSGKMEDDAVRLALAKLGIESPEAVNG